MPKLIATPKVPQQKAFHTIEELSERWEVHRSTIYREIRRGRLARKMIAGRVKFAVTEVERYERTA